MPSLPSNKEQRSFQHYWTRFSSRSNPPSRKNISSFLFFTPFVHRNTRTPLSLPSLQNLPTFRLKVSLEMSVFYIFRSKTMPEYFYDLNDVYDAGLLLSWAFQLKERPINNEHYLNLIQRYLHQPAFSQ